MSKATIGLFGFGVVGEGIFQVLQQKPQLGASIKKVVIKHARKARNAPSELFTTEKNAVLEDTSIDLVVELIDDAEAAFEIVIEALRKGKSVISANKKMIAEHHLELLEVARRNGVSFLYEAAVCGSIPVIRNLEEYFDNDLITGVSGIVNGSTNYVLSQMSSQGLEFDEALCKAQELGFAESDPTLDISGRDALCKLEIIALHAFGKRVSRESILLKGIEAITPFDINHAKERDWTIKLIATCQVGEDGQMQEVSVLPTFLPKTHSLCSAENEFNGILIGGQLSDEQFLYGKGAGRYPTSSAVLSDISAYQYQYRYAFKKGIEPWSSNSAVTKKFYLSFKQQANIDPAELGQVIERYETAERSYVTIIGDIRKALELHDSKEVSVIAHLT